MIVVAFFSAFALWNFSWLFFGDVPMTLKVLGTTNFILTVIVANGDAFCGATEPMWIVPEHPQEWHTDFNGRFHQACTWVATLFDLIIISTIIWWLGRVFL